MLANRHLLLAIIVAPALSLLAWLAVGELGGQQARPALSGQAYPLLEKSNCRYASGFCDLENGDFRLRLTYHSDSAARQLELSSSHPLTGVVISIGPTQAAVAPQPMSVSDSAARTWHLPLAERPAATARIRLVAKVAGSTYFVDADSAFLHDIPPAP